MKRMVLLLLAVLLLAGLLGALIAHDPGYLFAAWGPASLETSLWFAVLLLLVGALVLRALGRLVAVVLGGPRSVGAWRHRRKERKARQDAHRGLRALVEGNWARARKELDAAAAHHEEPLPYRLAAARAAHEQGDAVARDRYLEQALAEAPEAALAVGLTRAELQVASAEWEPALATLLDLQRRSPGNPRVLALLRTTYEALHDWQALAALIPDLRRQRLLTDADDESLAQRMSLAELHRAAHVDAGPEGRREALESAWNDLPKAMRHDPEMVRAYVAELRLLGADPEAETVLQTTLERVWDDSLVALYGAVRGAEEDTQLARAEAWLVERPNDGGLLLALGRLAMRCRQWQKAEEYLEAAIGLCETVEGRAELGRLLLSRGEHEAAARYLAHAAGASGLLLSDLPMPEEGTG